MSSNISLSCLEQFHFAYRDKIKKSSDVILVFVHWYLVKHGFVCVVDGKKTEILPDNWNADDQIYVIDYSFDSKGFELKVLTADDSLILNLMKKSNERTGNVSCRVQNHVSDFKNEFQTLYMNLKDLYESIDKEFGPLFKEETAKSDEAVSAGSTSRPRPEPDSQIHDPLRVGPPIRPIVPPNNYGRHDLDPFHFNPSRTGGMIFDPFRGTDRRLIPTNLPPGAVPPGARFDPFGPPNPDELIPNSSTRVGPNPNHMRPPNFDNLFM